LVKGLPDNKKPVAGQEYQAWEEIVELVDGDSAWKAACSSRDEKFGMHFTALVRGQVR
jgi:cysteinyl-tRNA synthetase